jgi:undecaprenyl-diphosphatase
MIVGLFFKNYVEQIFGSGLTIVGSMLILTALLLTFSYITKPKPKETISWWGSFIIGLSQAIAVLPGLSRSGATIATGLMLGYKKEEVARFSFLMVIIPVLGEAFLDLVGGNLSSSPAISTSSLVIGFFTAFVAGAFACRWMLSLVKQSKLIWFAFYCAVVGSVTLILSL